MTMKNQLTQIYAGTGKPAYRRHANRFLPYLQAALVVMYVFTIRAAFGSETTDNAIRRTIQQTLASETTIAQGQVTVHVEDGIVMLSGSVSNLLQKNQGQQIAESIRGVRSVVDTLSVRPIVREAEDIRRDIIQRLTQTPPRHGHDVSVAVENGTVTLTGEADSWVLSRLIARKAMSIRGVAQVNNEIDVTTRIDRADPDIELDVERRLAADIYIDASLIDVSVNDGRVRLEGSVGTAAEKRRAAENSWIPGVNEVDTRNLAVEWQASDNMRRKAPYIRQSDQAILKAVEDALLMDPRVNMYNPDVLVVNGLVTLSGVVDTLYAKQAAEIDAINTTGVWRVDNKLQLRYRAWPSSEEVKSLIEDVFQRDAELNAQEIDIAVTDNQVSLTGTVDTMGQKVRAENIASQLEGVMALDNRIRVEAGADKTKPANDADMAARITDQLIWSPYVDHDRIDVTVNDGQAVLTGKAADRFVAHIAMQNAFEGGASTVRIQLVLDGGTTLDEVFEKEQFYMRP